MNTPSVDSVSNGAALESVAERIEDWLLKHPDPTKAMATQNTAREEDAGSLTDSTYEFIDDDTESRDGNATESVASTNYHHSDDVTSLADTENSFDETESERSHATGDIPGYVGMNEETGAETIRQDAENFLQTTMETSGQPIIFDESPSQTGSVKTTLPIKDLSEDEIDMITPYLGSRGIRVPDHMSASLCQTMMSTEILTTTVPLRILYVGSRGAMHDIIRKIGSAVAAYMDNDSLSGSGSAQFYNVIPVSDFGSRHAPEIELMPSSGWNFQVEECLRATNFGSADSQRKTNILELTLDKSNYRSVPNGKEFLIQPKWELPHLSIFYCSQNDTQEMFQTRMAASEFTRRHNIAQIFITHKSMLESPLEWTIPLGHHPIHLSLEAIYSSVELKKVAHIRLPVDLASFMSIDARQMNRNLAYITLGSMEKPGEPPLVGDITRTRLDTKAATAHKILPKVLSGDKKAGDTQSSPWSLMNRRWRDLVPVGILITGVLASILVNFLNFKPLPANLVSINGNLTPTHPSPVTVITPTTTTKAATVSSGTSYEIRVRTSTSTKTITVADIRPSAATSISVVPSKEVAEVTEKFESKKSVCTAERIGDQEVLIRIPSATKLSWLAKEAMLVNVTRDSEKVDTERVYSSHDGIVLHFARHEAHGVLQIAVVTTKNPKVNETFHIDFGSSWTRGFHEALDKLCQRVYDDVLPKEFNLEETLTRIEDWRSQAILHAQFLAQIGRQQAETHGTRAAEAGREMAAQAVAAGAELAERVREPLGAALLKAQVDSKAQWLRMTGRFSEAREYEKKASEAGATTGKCSDRRCGWLGRKTKWEKAKTKKEEVKVAVKMRKQVLKERKAEAKKGREARKEMLNERKSGRRKTCKASMKARKRERTVGNV